jgi:hypothetical protein
MLTARVADAQRLAARRIMLATSRRRSLDRTD